MHRGQSIIRRKIHSHCPKKVSFHGKYPKYSIKFFVHSDSTSNLFGSIPIITCAKKRGGEKAFLVRNWRIGHSLEPMCMTSALLSYMKPLPIIIIIFASTKPRAMISFVAFSAVYQYYVVPMTSGLNYKHYTLSIIEIESLRYANPPAQI